MMEGNFNLRILANMTVALDRVCERSLFGKQHEVRKCVAEGILQCAKSGKVTLGALTEAGQQALARHQSANNKSV
jgi:hypothetical protein